MSGRNLINALRRQVASSGLLPTRGGGGAPYPGSDYKPVAKALDMEKFDEIWDDGTMNPEPVLDQWATKHISTAGALAYFAGGCSVFYAVWRGVVWSDAPSRQPYAPREFPYDNLAREHGL